MSKDKALKKTRENKCTNVHLSKVVLFEVKDEDGNLYRAYKCPIHKWHKVLN